MGVAVYRGLCDCSDNNGMMFSQLYVTFFGMANFKDQLLPK